MINKNIVIAALARDCKSALINNIPKIEKLRNYFKESHVVVVENDSVDGTKGLLCNWEKQSHNVNIISQDFGVKTIGAQTANDHNPATGMSRIEKMIKYRNIYLDFIRDNIKNVDYVLMIDIDIMDFDIQGTIKTINEAPDDWAGLFAFCQTNITLFKCNIKTLFYDSYAYIHLEDPKPFTYKHMHKQSRLLVKRINREIYSECKSAFGGLGIYKWDFIKNKRYVVEQNGDKTIKALCEHIPFNRIDQNTKAKLYISKYMVTYYGRSSLKMITWLFFPSVFFDIYQKIQMLKIKFQQKGK